MSQHHTTTYLILDKWRRKACRTLVAALATYLTIHQAISTWRNAPTLADIPLPLLINILVISASSLLTYIFLIILSEAFVQGATKDLQRTNTPNS